MSKPLTNREKNILAHNWDLAANKAATVTSAQIDLRLLQLFNLGATIDQLAIQNDCRHNAQMQQFAKFHCNKTGQFIRQVPIAEQAQIAAIHGHEKTINMLAVQFCQQTATQWLPTDSDSLHQLSIHEPIAYWVYASGMLVKPFTRQTTNLGTVADEAFAELTAMIDGFSMENAPEPKKTATGGRAEPDVELQWQQSMNQRIDAQFDRIYAYEYCESLPVESVIESNELMRRAMGLISPAILKRELPTEFDSLASIAGSEKLWQQFNAFLKLAIVNTIKKHASEKSTAICNADIANIKANSRGWSTFAGQTKMRGASGADSFAFDIRDFTVSEYQQAVQPKKAPKPKPIANVAFSGLTIKQTAIAKPTLAELLAKSKEQSK